MRPHGAYLRMNKINGLENIDKIILINETNEKKIYFWIITNLEGIKTFEDIKSAEIGV